MDRTRLRKENIDQRKSMKKLRETIIFWRKKCSSLSIDFTESSVISQQRIKKLEQQVKTLITQNQSLIEENKSLSECFDLTDTVVPDDSQPIEVEDVEKNKPVESPEKNKKRKRNTPTPVRKSARNKK